MILANVFMKKGLWQFFLFHKSRNSGENFSQLPETNASLDVILDMIATVSQSSDPVVEWDKFASHWRDNDNREKLWPSD